MERFRVLFRSAEFNPSLRKTETARLPQRKGCENNLALRAGKAIAFVLQDIVLCEEEVSDAFSGNAPCFTDLHMMEDYGNDS